MRARVAAARIALALLVVWPAAGTRVQAQPRPVARQGQEYHIEVNTLPGCFFFGCTQPVSAANIRVTAGGVRVPAQVAQPAGSGSTASAAVPVHVLVVFAPGTERPADAELLAKLKRVLAVGWMVSVCRIDGTFTAYAHEAQLRLDLAQRADAAKADAGLDAVGSAIDGLRAQAGYRVLVADLGGKADDKFVRWLASAADRLSPVYVSDGGKAQMPGSESSGPGSSMLGSATDARERAYTDGVFHEFTLAEALRDALADRRYEYDVRFRAPAAAAADAPIRLTFLDPGTHLPYELRTDLYTVETREAGGKAEKVRSDASSRLRTVEK
ncbi:MAG TPA: hypothetical protein VG267_05970 [Terracidiphilus sp.]|jgi:hypothetical protein|nr:hypothetical protein [Terracidiphilus sp.]